jgi:hypothetical protein
VKTHGCPMCNLREPVPQRISRSEARWMLEHLLGPLCYQCARMLEQICNSGSIHQTAKSSAGEDFSLT